MKNVLKISFLILMIIFSKTEGFAQDHSLNRRCATVEVNDSIFAANPELHSDYNKTQKFINDYIQAHQGQSIKSTIYIPVVFHVVLSPAQHLQFPDSRLNEQINALNRDFAGQNPHSMGTFSPSLKANTNIQFYIASVDPFNAPTTGIERRDYTGSSWGTNPGVKHYTQGGLDSWNTLEYLNIWVCDIGNGMCAYALYPSSVLSNEFGLVSHFEYVGITGAYPPYNNGSTSTHEIAHCLNLIHIWGNQSRIF